MRRYGFAIEITSLARARMTSEEKLEVHDWCREHAVRLYLWRRDRAWEASLTQRERVVARQSTTSPIDAFRAAAAAWDGPAIVSFLTGPAA